MISNLFKSKTRVKILKLFFENINTNFYIREIASVCKLPSSNTHRELEKLEKEKIIISKRDGKKKYFEVNKNYVFFTDLVNIIEYKLKIKVFDKKKIYNKNKLDNIKRLKKVQKKLQHFKSEEYKKNIFQKLNHNKKRKIKTKALDDKVLLKFSLESNISQHEEVVSMNNLEIGEDYISKRNSDFFASEKARLFDARMKNFKIG